MTNPLIISRLIEGGYIIYLPVNGSDVIVVRRGGGSFQECFCTNASQDKDHSPILRCPVEPMLTAVCDVITGTVWVIPMEEVDGKKNLRLGGLYEDYVVPEPLSRSYKEQKEIREERMRGVKEDALRMIGRMKEG